MFPFPLLYALSISFKAHLSVVAGLDEIAKALVQNKADINIAENETVIGLHHSADPFHCLLILS